MKNRIFLYLFVFAALICLFMVVSNGKMQKNKDAKIQNLQAGISGLKDSLQNSQLKVLDMQYFSLENNDDALAYYDHLKLEDPNRYISDKLLETNETKGDNPLIPYEGMESDFKLNKIKILMPYLVLCKAALTPTCARNLQQDSSKLVLTAMQLVDCRLANRLMNAISR